MEYIKKNRFLIFLFFLFAIIVYPMFIKDSRGQELLSTLIYSMILLSGLYAFSDPLLDTIQPLVTSLVLVLLLVLTIKSIRTAREVNHNVIFAVVIAFMVGKFAARHNK